MNFSVYICILGTISKYFEIIKGNVKLVAPGTEPHRATLLKRIEKMRSRHRGGVGRVEREFLTRSGDWGGGISGNDGL
jgi:hypothetical protein